MMAVMWPFVHLVGMMAIDMAMCIEASCDIALIARLELILEVESLRRLATGQGIQRPVVQPVCETRVRIGDSLGLVAGHAVAIRRPRWWMGEVAHSMPLHPVSVRRRLAVSGHGTGAGASVRVVVGTTGGGRVAGSTRLPVNLAEMAPDGRPVRHLRRSEFSWFRRPGRIACT